MKMGKKCRHFLQISLLGDWPIIRYEKVFTNEPELLDGGGVSLDESLGPDPHRAHPKGKGVVDPDQSGSQIIFWIRFSSRFGSVSDS